MPYYRITHRILLTLTLIASACSGVYAETGFSWPISCVPGIDCAGKHFRIGYPDVAGTGLSFACGKPGYTGHQGTDIVISSAEQQIQALAAADGVVRWIKDGMYDQCPNENERECDEREKSKLAAGGKNAATLGFNAGNFIVLEHTIAETRYLTLYAHLRKGSLKVAPGQKVSRLQKLADVGSSGNTLIPHLHFGVYKEEGGMFLPVDPWKGSCNTTSAGLWNSPVPYRTDEFLLSRPDGNSNSEAEVYYQSTQRTRPRNRLY